MNTLIFGGLIAIAVVALIILILVLMAEQRGQSATASRDEDASVTDQIAAARAQVAEQATSPAPVTPAPVPAAKTTIPVAQPVFDQERRAMAFNGSQHLSESENLALIRIRGQIREISNELRLLHKQSGAFEQRLAALSEAANYVEHMLGEQTNAEEAEETLS